MSKDIIYHRFTILENPNWKNTFKSGHIFIWSFFEELKGYKIFGLNEKKNRLISFFVLKEDIDKCIVIDSSNVLDKFIENMKEK